MKFYYSIFLIIYSILIVGCKTNSPTEPQVAIVGVGSLASDPYVNSDGFDITISAEPDLAYGFDADPSSRDVYLSIEAGYSNTFRLRMPVHVEILPGTGSLIASVSRSPNPVANYTYVITVTANSSPGSQMLSINEVWVDGNNQQLVDIETCPDAANNQPVRVYTKVYNKRILADINVYYLYNTTVDFSKLQEKLNKIYAQTVCGIGNVFFVKLNPDKSWDLNGNGQLDIYSDPTNQNDEFASIKAWAKTQKYWDENTYGLIVLEKPIIVHNNDGTISKIVIPGETDDVLSGIPASGNFTVVSSDADYDVAAHEFLHSKNSSNDPSALCLYDLAYDTYNLMYYLEFTWKNEALRYRPETRESGGTESQWQIMTGNSF